MFGKLVQFVQDTPQWLMNHEIAAGAVAVAFTAVVVTIFHIIRASK